uniref:F-box domain-containing protein n=1 Tax=Chlamydomonas chlamydogama TaxID=225041 RepID=A0A6T5TZS5_9CHLO|mmetsp:Transcript_1062/g.2320  ORF Transcript_1062/g.2320 Transcript_1062/m.2320 type:complete len:676 (+) Transcript_1062:241-2268(+)
MEPPSAMNSPTQMTTSPARPAPAQLLPRYNLMEVLQLATAGNKATTTAVRSVCRQWRDAIDADVKAMCLPSQHQRYVSPPRSRELQRLLRRTQQLSSMQVLEWWPDVDWSKVFKSNGPNLREFKCGLQIWPTAASDGDADAFAVPPLGDPGAPAAAHHTPAQAAPHTHTLPEVPAGAEPTDVPPALVAASIPPPVLTSASATAPAAPERPSADIERRASVTPPAPPPAVAPAAPNTTDAESDVLVLQYPLVTPPRLHRVQHVHLVDTPEPPNPDAPLGYQPTSPAKLSTAVQLVTQHCKNLRRLEILNHEGPVKLSAIPTSLPALSHLSLLNCPGVSTLSHLHGCTNLQELVLDECSGLNSCDSLSGLKQLQVLGLRWCSSLSDLNPLRACSALHTLDLRGCSGVTSLAPLEGCTALRRLVASKTGVQDIGALQSLAALEVLELDDSEVGSLEGLPACKRLHTLSLRRCDRVDSFMPLGSCTALQHLDLRGCEGSLTHLDMLATCSKLRTLDISLCPNITDIMNLGFLTALERVAVGYRRNSWGGHGIWDLSPLQHLEKLQHLNLTDSGLVSDLEPLRACLALRSLNLTRCEGVKDLSPLSFLPHLQYLNLTCCRGIGSLQPLQYCTALQDLDLRGCSALQEVRGLRGCSGLRRVTSDGALRDDTLQQLREVLGE